LKLPVSMGYNFINYYYFSIQNKVSEYIFFNYISKSTFSIQ
jgi:hypothetical protein